MRTFSAHFKLGNVHKQRCKPVGEGADWNTRGRVCSPEEFAPALGEDFGPLRPGGAGGFTMIEIAIALGVIAFALVAIIGVLPAGLNVQRDTHQDLIIGQDGPFMLEAIRNGGSVLGSGTSTSLDFLTNYVETITVGANQYNHPGSGQMILGLLSTPRTAVTARIRGLTGAATEQNGSNAVTSFRYRMDVEIEPFTSYSPNLFATTNEGPHLSTNLYEVRLKFSWPVRPNGTVGPGRQTYRSMVSGQLLSNTNSSPTLWFFQPNTYNSSL